MAHAELVELALEALAEVSDLAIPRRGLPDDLAQGCGSLPHEASVVGNERLSSGHATASSWAASASSCTNAGSISSIAAGVSAFAAATWRQWLVASGYILLYSCRRYWTQSGRCGGLEH